MLHISLGDEDRQRLGCPEWVTYDPDKLTLVEAEILDDHGIDWFTLRLGEPVLDVDGKPVLTEKGNPARRYKPRAQRVWIWSALRRAGVEVGFADFDVDMNQVTYRSDDEPPPSLGKDDSGTSEPTTNSSSPDSGAGPRRSRKP